MAKMSNRGMTKRFLISEMDRSVKRMLKLIEEEGDSFAKKAEIYLQKRPELVSHVEDFYRMFRSLAERYDNATCELSKSIPSDIQSRSSTITEACSEPPSTITSPEHRLTRRLSESQNAFLDIVGNKEGYATSTMDSESDSDDSAKEKIRSSEDEICKLRTKLEQYESIILRSDDFSDKSASKIAEYEEELRIAKKKIRSSEDEIYKLRTKLEQYESIPRRSDEFSDESEQSNRINALEVKIGGAEADVKRLRQKFDSNNHINYENREDLKQITLLEDEIEQLKAERDEFVEKLSELEEQVSIKDDQIDEMNDRLQKLQLECEKSNKSVEELRCKSRELQKAIEKQQEVIEEGAEEKRQAVRQLWISLEHYRNAYQMLRQDLLEHKKLVMAS